MDSLWYRNGYPSYKFLEKFGPYYDELCKKVGGVYLEGIEDFRDFLMSDWIPEMGLVIFSDSIEEESNELADIKNKLIDASQSVTNGMLSDLFLKIEERYLALSPLYAKASDIFEVAKLCDTVSENCIKKIYVNKEIGSLGRKTLGALIHELEDRGNLPRHLNLRLHRVLYYRNKIEHYDLIDPTEYEFTMIDLKTILTDMLTITKYSLAEKFLEASSWTFWSTFLERLNYYWVCLSLAPQKLKSEPSLAIQLFF